MALVILIDQFSRNIYRGKAEAFDADERTQALVQGMVADGDDHALSIVQRMFLYLPLEHAEDLELQDLAVHCYTELLADAPPELKEFCQVSLDFALRHRVPIAKFGRFPHRNIALGRQTSQPEQDYLDAHGGFV